MNKCSDTVSQTMSEVFSVACIGNVIAGCGINFAHDRPRFYCLDGFQLCLQYGVINHFELGRELARYNRSSDITEVAIVIRAPVK